MVKTKPRHPILPPKVEKYPSLVKTFPMKQHQTLSMFHVSPVAISHSQSGDMHEWPEREHESESTFLDIPYRLCMTGA